MMPCHAFTLVQLVICATEEVEVCVGLGAWQNKTIDTAEGWSRMGAAYHVGANVTCDSRVPNIFAKTKLVGFACLAFYSSSMK